MSKPVKYDVIIIGAGAAGLMSAAVAAGRGKSVLLLEKANKPGKKILMSGGGRCNFTNLDIQPEHYLSANPHYCKSALKQYTQFDFIELVDRHRIPWHEKTDGQLFCDHSAKAILKMLLAECEQAGVTLLNRCELQSVTYGSCFDVETGQDEFQATSLIIATGGLSVPTLGGSDYGFRLAREWGMNVISPSPGLVPFTLSGDLKLLAHELSGVSLNVEASTSFTHTRGQQRVSFNNQLLFTHRGLSGPAILQLSSYWHSGHKVCINLVPDVALADLLLVQKRNKSGRLRSFLGQYLPPALIAQLEVRWWPEYIRRPLAEWPDRELLAVAEKIQHWCFKPAGTEGYRTAEVTLGGVDCHELDSRSMASKTIPNLYFVGEAVDVTGQLGGYNFQWAWSSGWLAAQHV